MLKVSVAELVRKADTIIVGTVTEQESAWDAQHTAIHTDVTLKVERVLAGKPGETVKLRVAGGTVGGMGMRTSNDPVFRQAERVLVFLDTSADPHSLVGMEQGKFLVQDTSVTHAGDTWELDEFIAAVRAVAR
jgi:CYTH domain-containing protein